MYSGNLQHRLLLKWLILAGVLAFASVVVWDQGLIHILIASDKSRISLLIIMVFFLTSCHAAARVVSLSREINASETVASLFRQDRHCALTLTPDGDVEIGSRPLPGCLLRHHVSNLMQRFPRNAQGRDLALEQSRLLDALGQRVRGAHEVGWLVADLMLKLGLLGTVVGFILMLGAVSSINDFDVATMQGMLQQMSSGMRVALFTTLTGLVGGMLLGIQYHLVERGADELMGRITETTELYVLPLIENPASDEALSER